MSSLTNIKTVVKTSNKINKSLTNIITGLTKSDIVSYGSHLNHILYAIEVLLEFFKDCPFLVGATFTRLEGGRKVKFYLDVFVFLYVFFSF